MLREGQDALKREHMDCACLAPIGGDTYHKEDECERIGYGLVKGVMRGVEYVRVM